MVLRPRQSELGSLRAPPVTPAAVASPCVLATVRTFALAGVAARAVTVEVDVRKGLPAFAIVGLPDRAVRESARAGPRRDRQLRLRVPAEADHGQPGAGRPAQGGPGLRPRDRRGDPRRLRAAPARHARRLRGRRGARPRRRPPAGAGRPADGRGGGPARPDAARDRRAERPRGRARRAARPQRQRALRVTPLRRLDQLSLIELTGRARRARAAAGRRSRGASRRSRTSPSSAASRSCAARSRSPRRAATAC